MPTEPKWERVTDGTFRLPVPGGWLYRTSVWQRELLVSSTMTYVPNPTPPTDTRTA
jgi:hypothetical protein